MCLFENLVCFCASDPTIKRRHKFMCLSFHYDGNKQEREREMKKRKNEMKLKEGRGKWETDRERERGRE